MHKKLDDAFQFGDEELKQKLVDAIDQRAIGLEYEETQTEIQETKTGTTKCIRKYKK